MMFPDSDPSCNSISTLIFMDLESTGLPSFVGKSNVHITELSMIAVDRTDFETDSSFRVLNKLSLCIRPRSVISPTAMTITGLYNDKLEKQEKFDESIPKLFEYFFRRLRRPLCLLAHNGKKFDFPLLQAELRHINYALDPEIRCADTLEAFHSIVSSTNKIPMNSLCLPDNKRKEIDSNIKQDIRKSEKRAVSDDETDKLLSDDMELFTAIEDPYIVDMLDVPLQINSFLDKEFTTPKSKVNNCSEAENPHKRIKLDTRLTTNQYEVTTPTKSNRTIARRQLFMNDTSPKNNSLKSNQVNTNPTQFSLEKLYCHYFGEPPPNSHYAEADCIALSKVCQKISDNFLKWIDEHSTSFSEVSAMW
ncbi:three-prime repair exonuclease 1 [Caerostris darwini]|uniref:Three-prime repair exonuclease 1 n=1 Tax=Caerostris darwini TaxID=1538125 RepID=A0AAV4R9I6_9ARAC|nr:three-prime repair exonuclease 1 [Caerostris darwini]